MATLPRVSPYFPFAFLNVSTKVKFLAKLFGMKSVTSNKVSINPLIGTLTIVFPLYS